ncbi:ABC transporter substrate-binding protein [Breznakiella homolactica]|uniref:ABC transporter substrate-binding protein n=1 Tax=Breznakiella homolactica TaxID=2798577 RepID=A0A7T7XJM3_9SPIR|nr:ABC transporter substrate-binding protein [Breznakiella homolactica]QQO07437.1 ABC transporter substrate-binding protein [Breznakiella homolactica]
MKKNSVIGVIMFCCAAALFGGGNKDNSGTIRIGISKIVQHEALDAIEQGIQDEINAALPNVVYDLQNANGDMSTATQIANKFKSERVSVAVGIATPVAIALANTIKDVPVVFSCVTDPVQAGLVSSVDRGEGNVTGLSDAIPTAEHIAMFKEIAGIKTLGYIYTSSEDNSIAARTLVEEACAANGIAFVSQSISNSAELRQAAEAIVNRVDGIYLTTDNTVFSALPALIKVFHDNKKPIFSGDVTGALNGGCMIASGFNYYKAGRATGQMILEILDGRKPADMPVKFITDPAETDLLFDLDEAANCGITIPPSYLNAANLIFRNGKLERK